MVVDLRDELKGEFVGVLGLLLDDILVPPYFILHDGKVRINTFIQHNLT